MDSRARTTTLASTNAPGQTNVTRSRFSPLLTIASAFAASLPVAAAEPDAGAIRRSIEDTLTNRPAPKPTPAPLDITPAPSRADGVAVVINRFDFRGNTKLPTERLDRVVTEFVGRQIRFGDLRAAADAVAQEYRKGGWVVRALLPQQDLTNGVCVIEIVEATLGEVRVLGADGKSPEIRVAPDRLKGFATHALPPGQPLNAFDLDRAILLADDVPGVRVQGTLTQGATGAASDLVLTATPAPLVLGSVILDQQGARSTGAERVIGSASLASPFGLGDLISVNAMHTAGTDYGRVAASMPVGYSGARVGINVSDLHYRLVGSAFSSLNASGSSTSFGIDAGYPLIRSRTSNASLQLAFDHRSFSNSSGGALVSHYAVDALSATISGTTPDAFGWTSYSVTASAGNVDLAGSPSQSADASGPRTAGSFSKIRWLLFRGQPLIDRVTANLQFSGQIASKNLDSSEKFQLGGPQGVRAYPVGEGAGAEALLLNADISYAISEAWRTFTFFDAGRVRVDADPSSSSPSPNAYGLRGVGFGIVWEQRPNWAISAMVARRLGSHPAATATGSDQDGSHIRNRFWASVRYAF